MAAASLNRLSPSINIVKPARGADVAEDGDDRDGIGRRHDGAQHETGKERHAEGRPERHADHEGREENPDHGKQQHRRDLFGESLDVNVERRLEQQGRQKDIEERLRGSDRTPRGHGPYSPTIPTPTKLLARVVRAPIAQPNRASSTA